MEEEGLEGGALAGEESAGKGVGLGEGVEGGEFGVDARTEAVDAIGRGELAVGGELGRKGRGGGGGGEADFLLEG